MNPYFSGGDTGERHREEADVWIAPDGNNNGDGSKSDPYGSLTRAVEALRAMNDPSGTLVYCRGGRYSETGDRIDFYLQGEGADPIRIENYPGEEPVFDLSRVNHGSWDGAVRIGNAEHLHLRGLTFENGSNHNMEIVWRSIDVRLERCRFFDAGHSGVQINVDAGSKDIHIVDCESAYHHGSNSSDGFRVDPDREGGAVIFTRCVSHHNRDDGFDLWGGNDERIEYCVAYRNGYENERADSPVHESGNAGFKLSGGNGNHANTLVNSITFENALYGVACNDNKNPHTVYHVTSVGNPINYWVGHQGTRDEIRNCISYDGNRSNIGISNTDSAYNTWDLGIDDPRFVSEDPDSEEFLRLGSDSPCIDAGVNVGVPYEGSAPDVGAMRTTSEDTTESRSSTVRYHDGTGWVEATIKRHDGTSWQAAALRYHDGERFK